MHWNEELAVFENIWLSGHAISNWIERKRNVSAACEKISIHKCVCRLVSMDDSLIQIMCFFFALDQESFGKCFEYEYVSFEFKQI